MKCVHDLIIIINCQLITECATLKGQEWPGNEASITYDLLGEGGPLVVCESSVHGYCYILCYLLCLYLCI